MKGPARLIPPVYLLLSLAASAALHYTIPIVHVLPGVAADIIGFLVMASGVVITAMGAGAFKRAGTAVRPFEPATVLVREGLYRYSRKPMYVGLLLIAAGSAVAFGTVTPFLPPVVFLFILRNGFVLPEEAFLQNTFGSAFLEYKQQVRRWL